MGAGLGDAVVRVMLAFWSCLRAVSLSDIFVVVFWQYLSNRIKCIDKLTGGPFLE